jgi:class 3 adenylate cyclase/tetratricopeptide (TPR) repeat protein
MKFCGQCAAALAVVCASCSASNPPENKFCGQCAAPLGKVAEPRFQSPDAYTPKHLAERILTSKAALEGERKQVTVLFADLKGSMELLADRDPEEARKLLDPVLERMMEAVHHYEGTVNQVLGDGIMALFGAPLAHEDHAVRACYAALRMQEAVRRYAEDVRRTVGVPIHIRVGLNSGDVVVRAIGNDLHMDYTAVGQTTHLAARMEQAAMPGSTLITADALRLAEGYIQVKALGPIPVKGLTGPIEVFEVTGVGEVRTRLHAAAARGLTRFVGRDAELDQLQKATERAIAGHGQVVALVGEPGVGKSRLVWEFTRSHRTREWLILEGGSVSYGKATSYLPVIDLLKAYFKIGARDDHRSIREKVTGKLLTLDETLKPVLPTLLALLDVPVDDPRWQALEPSQRRQWTLDTVKRLLLKESQAQPVLLIFEDLHWIDSETQVLLDSLVESLPTARLLLLVNYRPEYQHGWGSKTYYGQVRLDTLPPENAGEMLQALLGGVPDLRPLTQLLIERTEGNPFFLEESVRTLVDTKVLVGERGALRLATALPAIQVPTTVQAVLAARIDRLPPEDKRLLQTAAVIGTDVPFTLLRVIVELPEEALRRGLTHLQAAEFLYETSLFPDLEYTFKHALTHEVAYASLLQGRRQMLHAQITEAIETLYAGRLTEHIERLSHHAVRGEVWEKAVRYLRRAGDKAFARSANPEAVASFEQALAALKHLPDSAETIEHAIDLRFDLRSPLQALGEIGRLFDYLREAQHLAEALGDQRRLGWLFGYLASAFLLRGDYDRAIESGERALVIATAVGDFGIQVVSHLQLGRAHLVLGDYRRATEFSWWNAEALHGDLTRERFGLGGFPAVLCRQTLAWSLAELGHFAEAIACGEDAGQIAETVTDPYSQIFACWAVGYPYLRKGDLDPAIRSLERGLMLCQATDTRILFPFVSSLLGAAYALAGRLSEAVPLCEQAVEASVSMAILEYRSLWAGLLSEAHLLAGRIGDAVDAADRALNLSREHKERGFEAWVLRLLGEIASNQNPPDVETAEHNYRQATSRAEELGMRPLVAHCHLGLGKLYRRTGDRQQAREHLATATTMYREMDMRFWLEQVDAETRRLA